MFPFIAIEGPDGSGKTTLRKGLFQRLKIAYGVPLSLLTVNYLDPATTPDLVDGKYWPTPANRDRYIAALAADKELTTRRLVRPSLAYRSVIADRWLLSELVFFSVVHSVAPELTLKHLLMADIQIPDVTLVLHTDVATSMSRAAGRAGDSTREDWDNLTVQSSIRSAYGEIVARPNEIRFAQRVCLINSTASRSDVLDAAWDAVHPLVEAGLRRAPRSQDSEADHD